MIILYLRGSIVISGDQVFAHLYYIVETVLTSVDFHFSVLMLLHQDLDSRDVPLSDEEINVKKKTLVYGENEVWSYTDMDEPQFIQSAFTLVFVLSAFERCFKLV